MSDTLTRLDGFIRAEAMNFRRAGIHMPITHDLLDGPIKQSEALFEAFMTYCRKKGEQTP